MSLHDEIREQQKKLKGQGFKAKLEYFWEYYKIHTIVIICAVALLSMLIHDIRSNKPYGFYAVMINSGASGAQEELEYGFAPYAGIDTSKYSCFIDTAESYDLQVITETTIATSQKIMANVAGGDLDVLAADSNIFTYYANQEVFADLRTVLSKEQIEKYQDLFIYVDQSYLDYLNSEEYQTYISTGEFDKSNKYAVIADNYNKDLTFPPTDPSEMERPIPVGIKLDNSAILKDTGAYSGYSSAAGVIINSSRKDLAVKFIEYLLN